jgi:hypothetical protein
MRLMASHQEELGLLITSLIRRSSDCMRLMASLMACSLPPHGR